MLLNCGVGEDSWESLHCKEIQPVHPKGDQSWVFIGRTDAEAETPILWPPDVKNWLFGKDPDAGKDWRQEKGTREDKMVGWHHWLVGHEFEKAPGVGAGQGSLVWCSPWGCKEGTWLSDWTELTSIQIGKGWIFSYTYTENVKLWIAEFSLIKHISKPFLLSKFFHIHATWGRHFKSELILMGN